MANSAFISTAVLQQFTPHFFPGEYFTFANFTGAISDGSFFGALGMSVTITLIVVAVCLVFAFLGAVAISRFKFRGRKSFVLALLLIQMLPAEGLFSAQYTTASSVGLRNALLGVSVIYIAAVIPFTVWVLRGCVAGVPAELEGAAMVDGLSRFQAFMRSTF